MKVIIEAQLVTVKTPRGMHVYAIEIIEALLKREKNEYGLAYFDYMGERNNRKCIEERYHGLNKYMFECNNMHYSYLNYDLAYYNKNYNDYINATSDVIHIPWTFNVPKNIIGNLVVTIHDLIPILPLYGVLPYGDPSIEFAHNLQRVQNDNTTVVAVSQATKADIVYYTNIPEENVHVVYNGINHDTHFPQKNIEVLRQLNVGERYFLCIGMMHESRKNFERIIKAFEIVAEKDNDIQLVSVGVVNMQHNINNLVGESKFKDRILLLPYVRNDQKRWLLSSAVALLYPSLYEGFGLPAVEAMACGAPVITSNNTSLPEAAGGAAILVDPYSIENMAYEMERLLNNSALSDELIQKGLLHSAQFTWERAAKETEKVYEAAKQN